jgi:hypothetical protein
MPVRRATQSFPGGHSHGEHRCDKSDSARSARKIQVNFKRIPMRSKASTAFIDAGHLSGGSASYPAIAEVEFLKRILSGDREAR